MKGPKTRALGTYPPRPQYTPEQKRLRKLQRAEELLSRHCEGNEADKYLDDAALAILRRVIAREQGR